MQPQKQGGAGLTLEAVSFGFPRQFALNRIFAFLVQLLQRFTRMIRPKMAEPTSKYLVSRLIHVIVIVMIVSFTHFTRLNYQLR